jgi:hypothetical protein
MAPWTSIAPTSLSHPQPRPARARRGLVRRVAVATQHRGSRTWASCCTPAIPAPLQVVARVVHRARAGLALPAAALGIAMRRFALASRLEGRFPPRDWKTWRDVRVLRDRDAFDWARRVEVFGTALLGPVRGAAGVDGVCVVALRLTRVALLQFDDTQFVQRGLHGLRGGLRSASRGRARSGSSLRSGRCACRSRSACP